MTDVQDLVSQKQKAKASRAPSLGERLSSIKDIIPPKSRRALGRVATKGINAGSSAINWVGKAAWVGGTSFIVAGLPLLVLLGAEEAQAAAQAIAEQNGGYYGQMPQY
eukprot:TRINITY_DN370_c0_g1_i1.p1 TRINITY_DN370_c0_g1~~TRINITY_DN370_c0_g1_i1.p1  ORF type:complete len:108 (+),score=24.06 TRINITY_DN370_c0_g1_i1:45-368(+)